MVSDIGIEGEFAYICHMGKAITLFGIEHITSYQSGSKNFRFFQEKRLDSHIKPLLFLL